ncbi:hypothetical protein [Streptomyces sp. NPDC088910]|uniref:hypothetical protein n=1 Tax=unclassified Streptomyces TaxID=2593676 RepID=UPI0037F7E8FE
MNTRIPAEFGTPTGTAWRTASGQLVQIYGNGDFRWACDGCLSYSNPPISSASELQGMFNRAADHAARCAAIQV